MKDFIGLALTTVGVVLLVVSFLTRLSHFNFLLLTALMFVVGGIVLHIWLLKRQEKY